MKILFVGHSNSARSQMAEGLAKRAFGPEHSIFSAGVQPTERSPLALRALQEIGIDITHQTAKSLADVAIQEMDRVVTLDSQPPAFPSALTVVHWPTLDPALELGSEQARMEAFRDTRDALENRIALFVAEFALTECLNKNRADKSL